MPLLGLRNVFGATIGCVAGVLLSAGTARAQAVPALPEKVDYNRDVRPILSDNCFACHGPDKNTRKADLRLDTKEGAFAALKGGGGHVVVPGKAGGGGLHRGIIPDAEADLFPPGSFNKRLTERRKATLKKW